MKYFIIILVALLNGSCETKTDCSNAICTEQFVTITMELTTATGNPYILDSYKTYIKETNESFVRNDDFSNDKYYPIISDLEMDKLSFDGTILVFEGKKDNVIVISEEITIGKDCCHISYISGKTKIVIQL